MRVCEKIIEIAGSLANGAVATDVRMGLGYTAVRLDDGRVGMAATFHWDLPRCCSLFDGPRPLAGRPAKELLHLFDPTDRLRSAVALATANALCNDRSPEMCSGDILGTLEFRGDDRVGMVGHFVPLAPLIREKTETLFIFEQIDDPDDSVLSAEKIPDLLPTCQVALITSTTLINHTLDAILAAARSCREVVLLGPSTPLRPDMFTGTPVTCLSGVTVKNPEAVLTVISEGGGVRYFQPYVEKVNVRLVPA